MHELTSDEDKARITALYQGGESAPIISALTEVPVHRVRLVLKEAGLLKTGGTRSAKALKWPQIAKMLEGASSYLEISQAVGVPYQTVRRWAQEEGFDTSTLHHDPTKVEQAIELSRQRLSAEQIAASLDVSTRTVSRWLSDRGVSTRGQRGKPPVKRDKYLPRVLELHEQGKSIFEIAAEIGDVHSGTVGIWLRERGVTPNYGARKRVENVQTYYRDHPQHDAAIERYLAGDAARTIDKELGILAGTTEGWAKSDGVWEKGGKFKRRLDRGVLARALHGQGLSIDQIAHSMKTDFYSTKRILVEEGLLAATPVGAANVCPCGGSTDSPNQRYCSPECRSKYGLKRQPDPKNHVTFLCQNESCGKSVTRPRSQGSAKYCSNECARTHTKTTQHFTVDGTTVLDSSWEVYVWGKLSYVKIPIERFDRQHGVTWNEGGWYAPDFWLPLYSLAVEVKGQPDDEDRLRWTKYRAERGPLVVLGREQMREFHELSEKGDLMELLVMLAAYQGEDTQFSR